MNDKSDENIAFINKKSIGCIDDLVQFKKIKKTCIKSCTKKSLKSLTY